MNSNKPLCVNTLKRVKDKLQSNYDVILINEETLLVKPNPNTKIDIGNSSNNSGTNNNPSTGTITVCPMNANANIDNNVCSCHSDCSASSSMRCPLNRNNGNTTNDLSNIIKPYSKGECLFRISPNDIYSGLAMHVLIIHNESTDLKMKFELSDKAIIQIVETINFLVK